MKTLQQQLEAILQEEKGKHLLLHSCCAPCSSYVLEYLSDYFTITLLYYNPNILPESEYQLRLDEVKRMVGQLHTTYPATVLEKPYDPHTFLKATKGLEQEPEGGERCSICYRLRLEESAQVAKELGADYFTTTLSISPFKNAQKLDTIALELEEIYGVKRLPSDFKKKNGYKRSIELSKEYNLYRQDWCGCPFSKMETEQKRRDLEKEKESFHKVQ